MPRYSSWRAVEVESIVMLPVCIDILQTLCIWSGVVTVFGCSLGLTFSSVLAGISFSGFSCWKGRLSKQLVQTCFSQHNEKRHHQKWINPTQSQVPRIWRLWEEVSFIYLFIYFRNCLLGIEGKWDSLINLEWKTHYSLELTILPLSPSSLLLQTYDVFRYTGSDFKPNQTKSDIRM